MSDGPGLLSVVIPVCNEADNVLPLAREVVAALRARMPIEILFVDDGSGDDTAGAVRSARAEIPEIRLLRHSRRSGQSAAVHSGVRRAHGAWIATLDGDGQNDPADFPAMLDVLGRAQAEDPAVRLIMGNRVTRQDAWLRRMSSRVANDVRGWLLDDGTPDTGCGIKLMHRETFLELPFFDHMHRFLPALYQRQGARVMSVPVNHRPRTRGTSKYGLHNRLWVGIVDMFGVMWLRSRFRPGLEVVEE
ncbi:MAG: glycosyltransferase family 2 protein [Chromatiales bacterium]|nr:MAG: glycosyltransferase family 2 protein [Chromatiales bacterium]